MALWTTLKLMASAALCFQAFSMHQQRTEMSVMQEDHLEAEQHATHRRLLESDVPAAAQNSPLAPYLSTLFQDLRKREKLFADTPPEEVKYWFEYTDPLQVSL